MYGESLNFFALTGFGRILFVHKEEFQQHVTIHSRFSTSFDTSANHTRMYIVCNYCRNRQYYWDEKSWCTSEYLHTFLSTLNPVPLSFFLRISIFFWFKYLHKVYLFKEPPYKYCYLKIGRPGKGSVNNAKNWNLLDYKICSRYLKRHSALDDNFLPRGH